MNLKPMKCPKCGSTSVNWRRRVAHEAGCQMIAWEQAAYGNAHVRGFPLGSIFDGIDRDDITGVFS
jgi:hypothetical protein